MRGLATSIVLCVLLAHAQVATAQSSGGPDSFGYIFQGTPFDFVALSGIGLATPLAVGDDGVADVTLPWPFLFYGSPHSSVRVGANGGLTFGSPGAVGFANKELPDGLPDSPDIAVFWDDLNPSAGGAVYSFHESVDNNGDGIPEVDRFILSWEGVPRYFSVGAGTFQVQLYPSGEIQFHWEDTVFGSSAFNYGGSATIGIQDVTGGNQGAGNVLQLSANSPWVIDGSATSLQVCLDDLDGDGFPNCLDCDDSNPGIYPGAPETCDGMDNDFDGDIFVIDAQHYSGTMIVMMM